MITTIGTAGAGYVASVFVAATNTSNLLFGPVSPGDLPRYLRVALAPVDVGGLITETFPSIALRAFLNPPFDDNAVVNGRLLLLADIPISHASALNSYSQGPAYSIPIPRLNVGERYLAAVVRGEDNGCQGWIALDILFGRSPDQL